MPTYETSFICLSFSLAASLLPTGSTATVGFGGYVGSSRLDSSSLATEDSVPFLVCISFFPFIKIQFLSKQLNDIKELALKAPSF